MSKDNTIDTATLRAQYLATADLAVVNVVKFIFHPHVPLPLVSAGADLTLVPSPQDSIQDTQVKEQEIKVAKAQQDC